jgi:glycosyltransferase involved in cell wall biosynthesis
MVALEALVLGVPVVAHAVGGLVPLLASIAGCRLVGSQDPIALARAIESAAPPGKLVPDQRESLLPPAYTVAACATAHEGLYRELARERA